jgi:hypothetical protein
MEWNAPGAIPRQDENRLKYASNDLTGHAMRLADRYRRGHPNDHP